MPSLGKQTQNDVPKVTLPKGGRTGARTLVQCLVFFPKGRTRKREPILPRGPLTDQTLAVSMLEDRG